MKRILCAALASVTLSLSGTAHADEALRRVQQSLREQGFYYGPVDGSAGDETTQAVRRYQIRNGLPVTGQLDEATKRSIQQTGSASGTSGGGQPQPSGQGANNSEATSRSPARPLPSPANTEAGHRVSPEDDEDRAATAPSYQRPTVRPVPDETNQSHGHDVEDEDEPAPRSPRGEQPDPRTIAPAPEDRPLPRNAVAPSARLSELFASTPYEFAPPPVQADLLRRAQRILTREGFYDGAVNGLPSELTSDSLANFQGVNRLRKTGRLDVNTLALLRLLPGRQSVGPRGRDDVGPNIIFEGRRGY